MKKLTVILLIAVSGHVFAELPIPATRFRKAPVDEVMQYARQDDAEAQLELALRYYAGHQVPRNAQEAFNWMSRSAVLTNPDAQFLLSRMYAEGIGTAADAGKEEVYFALALAAQPDSKQLQEQYAAYIEQKKNSPEVLQKFVAQCAEAGYATAYTAVQYPIAIKSYAKGRYDEALPVFRQLAEKGDPASAFYLAKMYSKGQGGLPEDHVEAFGFYERAARDNYAEAQYELALMYEEGRGVLEDRDKALFWYEKAAKNGHAGAQYQFAESEFKTAKFWKRQTLSDDIDENQCREAHATYRQFIDSAAAWYKKAAEQDHSVAQYMMGRLCASGEGVTQNFQEAVYYYELAAAAGHAGAQFHLGLMYHAGLGVPQDIAKAIQLYTKAADKNEQRAMFYLGNCYCFGVGVPKNIERGGQWYEKATEKIRRQKDQILETVNQGVIDASRELGIIRWNRAASANDFREAERQLGLAAQNGDAIAQDLLLKVNMKDRRSYRSEGSSTNCFAISMNKAEALADAKGMTREFKALAFYVQEELKALYPRTDAERSIRSVRIDRGAVKSISGEDLWKIEIQYQKPREQVAADFNGRFLLAIEFTDPSTARRYFAVVDKSAGKFGVEGEDTSKLYGYVNMSQHPGVKLTDYSVIYGHQLANGIVLAALDTAGRNGSHTARSFTDLCAKNRDSEGIDIIGFKEWVLLSGN